MTMERDNDGPTKILKHVYIGSQLDAKSKASLLQLKISHVLNCTPPKRVDPKSGVANYFEKAQEGFTYKRIPIFDHAGENILDAMEDAIAFIECSKFYGAVLVHCKKGVSRSVSFVIGYLMKMNEFSLSEALEYVQSLRPQANPNAAFMAQLKRYEAELRAGREARDEGAKDSQSLPCIASVAERPDKYQPPLPPDCSPVTVKGVPESFFSTAPCRRFPADAVGTYPITSSSRCERIPEEHVKEYYDHPAKKRRC